MQVSHLFYQMLDFMDNCTKRGIRLTRISIKQIKIVNLETFKYHIKSEDLFSKQDTNLQ